MTTTVKFYKVGSIGRAVRSMDSTRRDLTISALYHGLIHNNVSYLKDFRKEDAASFDTCLRSLIPAKWQVKGEFYQFDAKRVVKALATLEITDRDQYKDDFDSFAELVLSYWNLNSGRAKGQELTDQEAHDKASKAFPKMLERMYEQGMTVSEMETAFIMFKKAHTLVQAAA